MSYIDYTNDTQFSKIINDILDNKNFKKLHNITHHGISRWEHLIKVSYRSYKIARKLKYDYRSVARGALLHDFYLGGDERSSVRRFLDTFTHPKKALKTSLDNFYINRMEQNIILSHMFPFYPALPKYKESLLVDIVDKVIGSGEMLRSLFNKIVNIFKIKKSQ